MDYTSASDIALWQACRENDALAYDELYNRYWKLLYTLAVRKTGSKDDAIDMVQDLFVDMWNKRAQLEVNTTFEGYLKSSLYYKVFAWFRTKGFQEKHLKDFQRFAATMAESFHHQADPQELLAMEFRYEELMQVVNSVIEQMPDRMRTIFVMSRSQQYTINEIADRLNISPQTVKNQIHAAFTRLRKATGHYPANMLSVTFFIWLTNG